MMCVKYLALSSISGWGGGFFSPSDISHVVRQKFEDGVLCPNAEILPCRVPFAGVTRLLRVLQLYPPLSVMVMIATTSPALLLSASHRSHQATLLGINYKYFCIKKHIAEEEIRMPRSGPIPPAICLWVWKTLLCFERTRKFGPTPALEQRQSLTQLNWQAENVAWGGR